LIGSSNSTVDAEPLVHAEREGAHPLARDVAEPGDAEHFADPPAGDAVAVGQPHQVMGGAAAADDGRGVQQRADRPQRMGQLAVRLAVDQDRAGARGVQAQDHPHRGRLACPVWAEEAGDPAGPDDEGGFVDRDRLAVTFRQVLCLDHGSSFRARSGLSC
jgi:hypothetical protein